MPPRKRPRLTSSTSHPSTPTSGTNPNTSAASPLPTPATTIGASKLSTSSTADSLDDDWTPADEAALFKAIIRFKPTGIHKHMHMVCIASALRAQSPHLTTGKIWTKLRSLYDLSALDEREERYALSVEKAEREEEGDVEDDETRWEAEDGGVATEFALPVEDDDFFEQEIWNRRFKNRDEDEASSSPPQIPMLMQRAAEDADRDGTPARSKVPAKKGRKPGRKSAAELAVKEEEDEEGEMEVDDGEQEEDEDDKGTPARATRRSGRRK